MENKAHAIAAGLFLLLLGLALAASARPSSSKKRPAAMAWALFSMA